LSAKNNIWAINSDTIEISLLDRHKTCCHAVEQSPPYAIISVLTKSCYSEKEYYTVRVDQKMTSDNSNTSVIVSGENTSGWNENTKQLSCSNLWLQAIKS